MNPEEYWRNQAATAAMEYEQVLQSQRDELEILQRRCSDLLHERSMMKAATAVDIRNFCLHFQAQEQRRLGLTSASAVEHIPIHSLLQFLHTYSNGLLPPPENKRKRDRHMDASLMPSCSTSGGVGIGVGGGGAVGVPAITASGSSSGAIGGQPSTFRLYQRMLARQRGVGREADLEEWAADHQQLQQEGGGNDGGGGGGGGDNGDGSGGGGPVMTAASFGLPPHPM